MEKAFLAAGCFWGVEAKLRSLKGVKDVCAGYMGGSLINPTYQQVCQGDTGHAEAVEVSFDTQQLSYQELLEFFWQLHNPTTLNRQGPDIGDQYRSAIFFVNAEQEAIAKQSKIDHASKFSRPIVTEIVKAGPFYRAEEYHQRYLEKHGKGISCG